MLQNLFKCLPAALSFSPRCIYLEPSESLIVLISQVAEERPRTLTFAAVRNLSLSLFSFFPQCLCPEDFDAWE